MSVKKEPNGRRSVQVEVEVPGTPEDVWDAIASGPGVSSWFVPTEIDGKTSGKVVCQFGPGMDAVATITEWEPPRRFAAEYSIGPGAPTMGTEWIVEVRSGGSCVVRVVQSLFASTDDWDDQLTGLESGWPAFFLILKAYLARYRGQSCAIVQGVGMAKTADGWNSLAKAVMLPELKVGAKWATPPGVPSASGVVDLVVPGNHPGLLLNLTAPSPGSAFLGSCPMGEGTMLTVSLYLYGKDAKAIGDRERAAWTNWMGTHYPMGG